MRASIIPSLLLLLLLNLCSVTEPFGQAVQKQQASRQQQQQQPDSLILGNPSRAKTDLNQPDDYLVAHDGFTLSYNKSRSAANWVAWRLEKDDIGDAERTNAFAPDTTLPRDWWIKPNDYSGSGYDRGHLCPSKDRSSSEESNRETFLMSNMQPQTPKLNQKTWKYLEDYERDLVRAGNEAYIYAGCYGDLGKINARITIPARCWKIIVLLTEGENDLKRIDKKTRVIAVDMPNDETLSQRWRTYLTTIDHIEEATGYDFLSTVSKKIQKTIESAKDTASETSGGDGGGSDEPAAAPPPPASITQGNQRKSGGRIYLTGSRGGCYYLNSSGKKTYVDKSFCN